MTRWIPMAAALALAMGAAGADAKNTLRWSSQNGPLTADPHALNERPTNTASLNVHDPLVRRNAKSELEPSLALSWKLTNPTTWEFRLRAGVRFHDGSPFTADDVVFSIGRAKSRASDFRTYLESIVEVKKTDALTVYFVTREPNPILPAQLARISIMSKTWAEKHRMEWPQDYDNKEEGYAVRNANGTGPFILKTRVPGSETVLERNPAWWGWKTPQGGGNLDEIVYKPIRSAAARVAALVSGEIDFVLDLRPQDVEKIRQDAKLKVLQIPQIRTVFFGMDQRRKELRTSDVRGRNPFADKRVRRAMQMAIDTQAIKRAVMRGFSVPAGIITSPGVHGHTAALDKPANFELEAAKTLMTQAGYANGFSVKLDCSDGRYDNDEQICQAAVGMLGKIGIRVQLDARPETVHFTKLQRLESDFFLLGWGVPTRDSHYVLDFLYHTSVEKNGIWNFTGYGNAKMDALIENMAGETDLKKRDALIAEAWALAKADMVYLPIHHQVVLWGMVKSMDMAITGDDLPNFRWARMTGARSRRPN